MKTAEQIRNRIRNIETFNGELTEKELDSEDIYYDEGEQAQLAALRWVLDED